MSEQASHPDEFDLIEHPALFQQELEFVREERLRRSQQQFEYIKMSLISLTVSMLVGVLGLIGQSAAKETALLAMQGYVLPIALVLSIISFTLFLFWIDDALTIAGLDRFMRHVEERVEGPQTILYYGFRDHLNQSRAFKLKRWIFDTAILVTFFSPPALFAIFVLTFNRVHVPDWIFAMIMAAILAILAVPLLLWRRMVRSLYGG